MERWEWPCYPWQVDSLVVEWQRRYPDLLAAEYVESYTRHKVWAVTVTDSRLAEAGKRGHLFYVPHAHEPAGTVACLNFVSQLLTGHHLDGAPSTLAREDVLAGCTLSFIPDANPYGRSRCPEPFWEGTPYNNREFINMVFGIGDQHSQEALKPSWERYKRIISFSVEETTPARIGLVYEQVSEHEFVEPGRYDERASMVKLIRSLRTKHEYAQVLALHQTEFEGQCEDCMLIPQANLSGLPESKRSALLAWSAKVEETWRSVGGQPEPLPSDAGSRQEAGLHRRHFGPLREELQRESLYLVSEVKNNSPDTPAEVQLLLDDTAIWASVEHLMAR